MKVVSNGLWIYAGFSWVAYACWVGIFERYTLLLLEYCRDIVVVDYLIGNFAG